MRQVHRGNQPGLTLDPEPSKQAPSLSSGGACSCYLVWGKSFRPQDIYAGDLLSAIEAIDAGVTTSVDWSHNLHTTEHAEAAVEALRSVPGRFVLAYGNIQQAPWEWR